MRAVLAISLLLFSCVAGATNVLFIPFINPDTKERDIIYLTDQHSTDCIGEMRTVNVETDKGKKLSTSPICWTFGEYGENTFSLFYVSTKAEVNDISGFSLIQGSEDAWQAVLIEHMHFMQLVAKSQQKAWGPGLKPHP